MTRNRSWLCPVALSVVGAALGPSAAGEPTTLRALYRLPRAESIDPAHTALVLVDFQEEFVSGKLPIPTAPVAVERARVLLDWARTSGVHVIHVQNVTRRGSMLFAPESPTIEFLAPLRPRNGEPVVVKHQAGAFSRTDLDTRLRALGVQRVVLAGIMTHLAVDTSARDAAVLGYEVIVAADATATRSLPGVLGGPPVEAATVKQVALASLADRFAEVLDVEQIALSRSAEQTMGTLLALVSAILAASLGLLSAVPAADGLGPLQISFWRAALAAPMFLGHARLTCAPALRRDETRGAMLLGGVLLTALFVSYQWGIRTAGVSLGTAIAEAAPALVVPLAWGVLGEPMTPRRLLGASVTVSGVWLASGAPSPAELPWRALLPSALAALAYASFYVGSARLGRASGSPKALCLATATSAVVLLPSARMPAHPSVTLGALLLLALVCTYGAYLAKGAAIARLGATRVAALCAVEPALAALAAVLVLGERVPGAFVPGLAVEVAGVVLLSSGPVPPVPGRAT